MLHAACCLLLMRDLNDVLPWSFLLCDGQVWVDAKCVNAISQACFSKDTKIMQAALHFFLGVEQVGDDDRDVSC